MHKSKLLLSIILCLPIFAWSQVNTNTRVLKQTQVLLEQQDKVSAEKLLSLAFKKGWKLVITGMNGQKAILVGVDPAGYPLYTTTLSNVAAAATINTNQLWPGGRTGLNLTGSSDK